MGTKENPVCAGGAAGRAMNLSSDNLSHHDKNIKRRLAEYLKNKGIEPNDNGFIKCLWHEDKNPSCKVNDEFVYCFACNESGDIFKVAAALLKIPCDKENFRAVASDVEKTLGLPEWKPPKPVGNSRFRLSRSAVYRRELQKKLGAAFDAGDEEQAVFWGTLFLALDKLPEAK